MRNEMRVIERADRTNYPKRKYVEEGYIVEYNGTFYFVDTEGNDLTADDDWFKIEREYVVEEIDSDDDWAYWLNNKHYTTAELLIYIQNERGC